MTRTIFLVESKPVFDQFGKLLGKTRRRRAVDDVMVETERHIQVLPWDNAPVHHARLLGDAAHHHRPRVDSHAKPPAAVRAEHPHRGQTDRAAGAFHPTGVALHNEIQHVAQEGWQVRKVLEKAHPLALPWVGLDPADFLVELEIASPVDPPQDVHHGDFAAIDLCLDGQRGVHFVKDNQAAAPVTIGVYHPVVIHRLTQASGDQGGK